MVLVPLNVEVMFSSNWPIAVPARHFIQWRILSQASTMEILIGGVCSWSTKSVIVK